VPAATPTDPAAGVAIGEGTHAIRIFPDPTAASTPKLQGKDGVSVYRGSGAVSTVVESTPAGARISTVALRDHGADQQTFGYRLGLPRDHRLRSDTRGGAEIVGPTGTVNARILSPWAKDADGVNLPTAYRVDGDMLIQTIDTRGATFPVVADPEVEILYVQIPRREHGAKGSQDLVLAWRDRDVP
jgi:hypothetical protein